MKQLKLSFLIVLLMSLMSIQTTALGANIGFVDAFPTRLVSIESTLESPRYLVVCGNNGFKTTYAPLTGGAVPL